MSDFKVIRKSDGEEVIRYSAAIAQEVSGFDLVDYDHIEFIEGAITPQPRILTKLDYLRLFTAEERITIRTVAKTNAILEDYLSMLELADEINTGDPDTIAAVQMLEQAGLIAAGRASEVLNG